MVADALPRARRFRLLAVTRSFAPASYVRDVRASSDTPSSSPAGAVQPKTSIGTATATASNE